VIVGKKLFAASTDVEDIAFFARLWWVWNLGLLSVKAIVEAHGGTISAGASELGGVQICHSIAKGSKMTTASNSLIVEDENGLQEVVRT